MAHASNPTQAYETLAIGCQGDLYELLEAQLLTWSDTTLFVEIDQMQDATLPSEHTSLVISPVFAPGFDAFDIARLLAERDYGGLYRAYISGAPNLKIIRNEICQVAPQLQVEVVALVPPDPAD